MADNKEKRDLRSYAEFFFSEQQDPLEALKPNNDDLAAHNPERETSSKSMCAFCHIAYEEGDPFGTLLAIAHTYQKCYDRVHVITSRFNEHSAIAFLTQNDYKSGSSENLQTFWNSAQSVGVSFLSEIDILSFINEQEQTEKDAENSSEQLRCLILFDAASFTNNFLDRVCGYMQQIIVMAGDEIADLIEAYQFAKSYSIRNATAHYSYVCFSDVKSEKSEVIKTTIIGLMKKHLTISHDVQIVDKAILDRALLRGHDSVVDESIIEITSLNGKPVVVDWKVAKLQQQITLHCLGSRVSI